MKLLIAFLIMLLLKLTGVINWSWWLITLPLYLIPGVIALIIVSVVILALLNVLIDA